MNPTSTAAAVVTVCAVSLAVGVPALSGRGWRNTLLAGAVLVATAAGGAALLVGPGPGLAAALPLAGFALAMAGMAAALGASRLPAAAASGLAGMLGCGLLVLPFLADPLVESRGPGRVSPGAVAAILGGSPLAASLGGGLGVDFLKTPRAYGGSGGGGLSRIGAYYSYAYPAPLASGAGFAVAGALLLAGSGVVSRRSPR